MEGPIIRIQPVWNPTTQNIPKFGNNQWLWDQPQSSRAAFHPPVLEAGVPAKTFLSAKCHKIAF
jgi:hypothetical protein